MSKDKEPLKKPETRRRRKKGEIYKGALPPERIEEAQRLYAQHRENLLAFARKKTVSPDVEDFVHDAFLKAMTRHADDGPAGIGLLIDSTRKLIIDYLRRRERQVRSIQQMQEMKGEAVTLSRARGMFAQDKPRELLPELRDKILRALTPDERKLFDLRFVQNKDRFEIAGILEIEPDHASVKLSRLNRKMRNIVRGK